MKSWGVFFVTAMGFLVGMVLAGVGGLSAKTSFFLDEALAQTRKLETYWVETSLNQNELYQLISNSNCQSSEKYFLSCINSVVQTAEASQMVLSAETGLLGKPSPLKTRHERTEKDILLPFVKMYAQQKNHLVNFESLWDQLLNHETSEKRSAMIATGINSFLSIYKDPHTYILPNNYYEEVASKVERANTFIGVAFEMAGSEIQVRKVFRHSDADVSGLKAFDQILSLDETAAAQLDLKKISQILGQAEKKSFRFKVMRQGEIKEVVINRRYQHLNHVQFDLLFGARTYALITLTKFNNGVCAEVTKQIKSAADKNISGLILDLRDNPGGQLDEAACLAGLFIGINKKIYSVEYFDPVKANEVVLTSGSLLYTGPLTILVNSSSASASELFAGALQEYGRALVVGEKTFGKGTFQESEIWSKNNRITLFKTQGFYLLPSNYSTQIVGVEPDIKVVETHSKVREESNYMNPIANHKLNNRIRLKTDGHYEETLQKCVTNKKEFITDDLVLKKAIDILSCRTLTTTLATRFNVDEFN